MKASPKIHRVHHRIPVEVRQDLLALGLLRRQLRELVNSIEYREDRIAERLLGVRSNTLLSDLLQEHNERAARIRAVQS